MGACVLISASWYKSITCDRGIEFRNWRNLKPGIGTEAWFCDPVAFCRICVAANSKKGRCRTNAEAYR